MQILVVKEKFLIFNKIGRCNQARVALIVIMVLKIGERFLFAHILVIIHHLHLIFCSLYAFAFLSPSVSKVAGSI